MTSLVIKQGFFYLELFMRVTKRYAKQTFYLNLFTKYSSVWVAE